MSLGANFNDRDFMDGLFTIFFRACLASLQKYIKVVYYSQKRKSDAK